MLSAEPSKVFLGGEDPGIALGGDKYYFLVGESTLLTEVLLVFCQNMIN